MEFFLENEEVRVKVSSKAGQIESIFNKRTGNEHYWQYDSAVWPRRTSICFPVCGLLTDEEYRYEGKTYSLPNHGILREYDLEVKEHSSNKVVLQFRDNEETRKSYPFHFCYTVEEELEGNALVVRYTVENTGEGPMYYATGSHYTYNMPIAAGEKQSDYVYQFEGVQNAGKLISENGQIAGKTDDIFHGKDYLALAGMFEDGSTVLDMKDISSNKITIRGLKSDVATEVMFEGFDYCVLWAKPGDCPFVCIEPWTAPVDQKGHDKDITKKMGITKLEPGEKKSYLQRITVR